ncbi:MAG: ABC-F family ATP-binding cassette domain-containing protein [Oscillospiraceae bacterium]
MLVSIENLSKFYGATQILDKINLVIEDNDRIGLIGANGAGKSTLLNIIDGTLDFEQGERNLSSDLTIGFLKQNSGLNVNNTIWSELKNVFKDVNEAIAQMHIAENKMSLIKEHNSSDYSELLKQYTALQAIIDAKDGYNIEVKINKILTGMGFSDKPRDTIIGTLSGGEKTRLALCKLLLEEPQLLILDEPTNHLDFKTLTWLEDYLKSYKGALLIVSHDRFFLNSLITSICEIEHCKLSRYPGNYSQFAVLKEERVQRQQKTYDAQQLEIKKLEDYVAKNLVRATTSAMAKSRRKTLERMDVIDKPLPPPKKAKLSFTYQTEPVKDILHVKDLCLSVGTENRKQLMQHFDLDVMRGEKIAIIGENGIGKSSMLKAIQGIIPIDNGDINWGRNVKTAYFDQENGSLSFEKTALMELWDRFPSTYELGIKTILGNVLITQEESQKNVGTLSGGERAKLKFAIMMMESGNVLILDEPTNHLDLDTKEILDKALNKFEGTIIMVSHDRYLLTKVPTKIVEITSNGKTEYKGNYYDYLEQQKLDEKQSIDGKPQKEAISKSNYNKSKEQRSAIAALRREKIQLENDIEITENQIKELEALIVSPEFVADYEKLSESCSKVEILRSNLDVLYEKWALISDQIIE